MKFNIFKKSTPALETPAVESPSLSITEKLDDYFEQEDSEALDVVADMLYRTCWPLGWVPAEQIHPDDWTDEVVLGVLVKTSNGAMRSCPMAHEGMIAFEGAAMALKVAAAVKMRSRSVEYTFKNFVDPEPEMYELYIDANTRIQVLASMDHLATARRSQYAALIRDEGVLVVWADSVDALIPTTKALEQTLINLIRSGTDRKRSRMHNSPSAFNLQSSRLDLSLPVPEAGAEDADPEKAAEVYVPRTQSLISAVSSGLSCAVIAILLGLALNSLMVRYMYDKDVIRFALVAAFLPLALLVSYPVQFLVTSLLYIFGPISQYNRNTHFFSAIAPSRGNITNLLPITVQLPVYKESLEDVLIPTIESLRTAMTTFERQGGSVNLIVCDDGLQNMDEVEARARIQFYAENDISYVARPPHGVDGFVRRGKFKKAGNLNHTNALSIEIEQEMNKLRPEVSAELRRWTETEEKVLYERVKQSVLESRGGKTWAAGNVRIGEIVLLVDSDTRVPNDCFMDASLELTECPEVAIIQHQSGAMQVAHHFFENLMAYFTRITQLGISMSVAGGTVAPFVGHNAFLRWSAMQEVAFVDPYDGQSRVWSEDHVSEDFQLALSLQAKGWVLRWATYAGTQFQEGVSLTAVDELNRWQKYAWGCSEIIFNPFKLWFRRGPITKLYRQFLWSSMAPHSKFGIIAYTFSYYAISSAWLTSIISFVLIGSFGYSDSFYSTSWDTLFVCTLLFAGLMNLALCILHYRLKIAESGRFTLQLISFIPIWIIFFLGLSIPVGAALASHMLSINMSWTATSKSVERSNFFLQLPKILKRFWFQLGFSVIVLAGLVVSTTSLIPIQYRVINVTMMAPLAITYGGHLVWPFILDPYLLTFSY